MNHARSHSLGVNAIHNYSVSQASDVYVMGQYFVSDIFAIRNGEEC